MEQQGCKLQLLSVLKSPGAAATEAPAPSKETPEPLGWSGPRLPQLEERPPSKADPAQLKINKLSYLKIKKRREEQQRDGKWRQ